jgi:hypothetical protein
VPQNVALPKDIESPAHQASMGVKVRPTVPSAVFRSGIESLPTQGSAMSILRNFVITAFAVSAMFAAPSAALASTAQHATAQQATVNAVMSPPGTVHRAPCTGVTFNVYHDHTVKPICYAGFGTKSPHIAAVTRITTGRYFGCLRLSIGHAILFRSFNPKQSLLFPSPVELLSFQLAGHPVACPQ